MKCKHCKEAHKNDNTGCRNSGNGNSGDMNSGDMNSGYWNSGGMNSGDMNSGVRNSGYWNSGGRNSGDWNSGGRNSGDWNSGDMNSGYFNTGSPNKIQVFNEWVEMTNKEFEEKYNIYADLPLNRWVGKEDMSEEEKYSVENWEQMGGYLKTLNFKEACIAWWSENKDRHADFLGLPNFDAKMFKEITGIDVEDKGCCKGDYNYCPHCGKEIK